MSAMCASDMKRGQLRSDQTISATASSVVIVVAPVGPGKFRASLEDGRDLVPASATPFLSACRKLLDLGYHPRQQARMHHAGSDVDALLATIDAAAGLTVAESGTPRFARLRSNGLYSCEGSPPIAPSKAVDIPSALAAPEASRRKGGCT